MREIQHTLLQAVREMQHALFEAALRASSGSIAPEDLLPSVTGAQVGLTATDFSLPAGLTLPGAMRAITARRERAWIFQALAEARSPRGS